MSYQIMKGLKEYQAVKFGEKYLVTVPSGTYEIDGTRVSVGYGGYQGSVGAIENIVKVTKPSKSVLYYEDEEGSQLTLEEFKEHYKECNKYFDEETNEHSYPSLEEEFNIRKISDWLNTYKPVYDEPEEFKETVELTLVGSLEPTGSDAIESSLSLGSVNFQHSNAPYKVYLHKVAVSAIKEAANELEVDYEFPSHSGLTYVKVHDQYVMTFFESNRWCKDVSCYNLTNTLEEAYKVEKELFDRVYNHVVTKVSPKIINKKTVGNLYSKVESLYNRSLLLDVKKASRTSRHGMVSGLKQLLEMLQEEVK